MTFAGALAAFLAAGVLCRALQKRARGEPMARAAKTSVDRRDFLKQAAVAGAALSTPAGLAEAQSAAQRTPGPAAPVMTAAGEAGPLSDTEVLTADRTGS